MSHLRFGALFLLLLTVQAPGETLLKGTGVVVSYSGIDKAYAVAMGRVVMIAREALKNVGFDMPDPIHVYVEVESGQIRRIWDDGRSNIRVSISSQADLRPPILSGTFWIYGLCRAVAHLASWRLMGGNEWMSLACNEGWAHYLGSRLVDVVYEKEGEGLWPVPYDYREEGMRRLKRQLSSLSESEDPLGAAAIRTARLWMELAAILPMKSMPALFRAWREVNSESSTLGSDLGRALSKVGRGDPRLMDWWRKAEAEFVKDSGIKTQSHRLQ